MLDLLSVPPVAVAGKDRIVPEDVLFLRKHLFPGGLTSAEDAAALVAIHRSCPEKCPEWDAWFIEALTAFVVFHSWPQYSLDDINAGWLISLLAEDDVVRTPAEFQLLLHVIEVSRHVPEQLSALAIRQLLVAIATGQGACAMARSGKRRGIGHEDIALLYRVLKTSLHAGKMVLGRAEIDVLFEIDRLVADCRNHPAWDALLGSISRRPGARDTPTERWLRMLESDLYAGDEAVA